MSTTTTGYVTVGPTAAFLLRGAGFYGSLGGSTIAAPRPGPSGSGSTASPRTRSRVDPVNVCEEGGQWNVDGSVYSGGLGMSRANWDQFKHVRVPGGCGGRRTR